MRYWAVGAVCVVALLGGACVDGGTVDSTGPSLTATTSTVGSTTTSSVVVDTTVGVTATTLPVVDPPPTTVADTVTLGVFDVAVVAPGLLRIDAGDPVYRPPGLFEFPDGRIRVVYTFGGVEHSEDPACCQDCEVVGETVVRMATCTTVACSQVEVIELLSLAPYVMAVSQHDKTSEHDWVAFTSDGVPVFVWWGWDATAPTTGAGDIEVRPTLGLATCTDPTCSQTVSTERPDRFAPLPDARRLEAQEFSALASTPDGGVGYTYSDQIRPEGQDASQIAIVYAQCDVTLACALPEAGMRIVQGQWASLILGGVRLSYTAAGNPIVTYFNYAQPGPGQWLATCHDSLCAQSSPPRRVNIFNNSEWPGTVLVSAEGTTYVTAESYREPEPTTGITITWCSDTDCTDSVTTVLHTFAAGAFTPYASALGSDNLPRLVWTTREGFEYARCLTPECTSYEITFTGIPAKALSMITNTDGHQIIGITDETGINLLHCPSESCSP